MMTSPILLQYAHKLLKVVNNLSFWLFSAITIIGLVFIFSPLKISIPIQGWWPSITIVAGILAVFKGISNFLQYYFSKKASAKLKKTFHLTVITQECFWVSSKQSDRSIVTQLRANFNVQNCTHNLISLVEPRLKKLFMNGEVIHNDILIDHSNLRLFSTDHFPRDVVPAGQTLPVQVLICFRGNPPRTKLGKHFRCKLYISDSSGNTEAVKIIFKSIYKPKEIKHKESLEVPSLMADPIEKEVVSILQLELYDYDKCGRSIGGLGSIRTAFPGQIPGQESRGVGSLANQSENQIISSNPAAIILKSHNLEALTVLYKENLTSESEKTRFIECLINRIDEHKKYMSISYFIVCVLWKLGYLHKALKKVKSALPQGEIEEFGFSNVLMLLNGLLSNHHPDFNDEEIDFIEQFIGDLNEHTFTIAEKIKTIRRRRLLDKSHCSKEFSLKSTIIEGV